MKAKRKADGRYRTTRETYKAAKRLDHTQFDDFCTAVYTEGVRDGKASVSAVGTQEIMAAVKTVRGLGDKRLALIEAAIAACWETEKANTCTLQEDAQ